MKLKRIALVFLALCALLSLSSCNSFLRSLFSGKETTETEGPKQQYIIRVVTAGGMPLEHIYVSVYDNTEAKNLVANGITDSEGFYRFSAKQSDNYIAELKGFSSLGGYVPESYYSIKSKDNEFAVKTELIEGPVKDAMLGLGDVAFDFEITDSSGATHKASEILKTKKALVLNFWFENCGPCKMEFPYMQEAYNGFKDKLEILALNPLDSNQQGVEKYAESMSLTFPMASVDAEWQTAIKGLAGYPTTVIIDRYGMVVFMHTGAITEKEVFEKLFAYFTADDYIQKPIKNISEIQ
ncbi:MAG: redoxin domain-containing protein [Clostridia bacterium]|nr:redoxin domain-containing protein [Clostridia bacterium]